MNKSHTDSTNPYQYILRYYLPLAPDVEPGFTEDRFNELLDLCRTSEIEAVMFYVACHPEWYYLPDKLEHAAASAGEMMPWIQRLRKAGISYQINFQNLGGAWDGGWDFREYFGWEMYVNADGQRSHGCACLLGQRFREVMTRELQIWAQTRPDVIWMDDDFRLHNHSTGLFEAWRGGKNPSPLDFGCYCNNHLNGFAKKTGNRYTREEIVAAVLKPGIPDPVRESWLDYLNDAMCDTAEWVEKTIHEVSPETRVALMTSVPDVHAAEGRRWSRLLPALSGDNRILLRPHFGPYAENSPREFCNSYLYLDQLIEDTSSAAQVDYYPELENTRFTVWSKSIAATRMQMILSAYMGCPGITLSIFDLYGVDLQEEKEWGDLLKESHPLLTSLKNMRLEQWRRLGVILVTNPEGVKTATLKQGGDWPDLCGAKRLWGTAFASMGVPCYYKTADSIPSGSVVALDGYSVSLLTDCMLKRLLASNDLILDSEAAARIEERGFSALTGVGTGEDLPFVAASEEWTEKGEAYRVKVASRIPGNCWKKLVPTGDARRVTMLISPDGRRYPGLVYYKNPKGRAVLTYAAHTLLGDGFFTKKRVSLWKSLIEAMSGEEWVTLEHQGYGLFLARKAESCILVCAVNLGADPIREISLKIKTTSELKKIWIMDEYGNRIHRGTIEIEDENSYRATVACSLHLYGVAIIGIESMDR